MSPTHLRHPLKKATILDILFKHGDPYKVQLTDCKTILDVVPCNLLPYDPDTQEDITGPSLTHPWCKHKARCTVFLTELMAIPKHGIIVQDGKNLSVQLGHSLQSKSKSKRPVIIPLPSTDLKLNALLESGHLIEGW